MKFGYILTDGDGQSDVLLCAFAKHLETRRLRLAGIVQTNTETTDGGRCDMDVRVLGGGPVIRISQSLGEGARGCRLDAGALEQAVAEVTARMDDDVDLLLLNKYGKHESEGRGFRTLIADALDRDLPVLVAVNRLNLGSFLEFSAGLAEVLPNDHFGLQGWLGSVTRSAAA